MFLTSYHFQMSNCQPSLTARCKEEWMRCANTAFDTSLTRLQRSRTKPSSLGKPASHLAVLANGSTHVRIPSSPRNAAFPRTGLLGCPADRGEHGPSSSLQLLIVSFA